MENMKKIITRFLAVSMLTLACFGSVNAFAQNTESLGSDADVPVNTVVADEINEISDEITGEIAVETVSEDATETTGEITDETGEGADATANTAEDQKKITVADRSGGMLSFLYKWLGAALKWLYEFCGNYIVAILIFALAAKIVLFPFSIKQQKNSQKMARLAPKQEAIRKKYAGRNDRATQMKMNEEIQQLYADEKFNPMGGCLPMLLQLPIIFVLYSVITNPLTSVLGYTSEKLAALSELFTKNSHLFEGIRTTITETDAISKIANATNAVAVEQAFGTDMFNEITSFYNSFGIAKGFNLMDNPSWSSLLFLIPALVFLSSFFSTKIIRKFTYTPNAAAQDASMKVMDWTMPLMILWFSFQVPALVGIYWVFQNIISIGQQYLLYKLFPVKAPTPEEIREAELLMRGKKSKKSDIIDDEDEKMVVPQKIKKAPIKKKKGNSLFIYAKKGIDPKYLSHIKEKGKPPKARMKP